MESKLTAKQKRKLFSTTFGEKLEGYGFSKAHGGYFRLHAKEVLIWTALYLGTDGEGTVLFDAIPFCIGFKAPMKGVSYSVNHIVQVKNLDQINSSLPSEYFRRKQSMPFEDKLQYLYREYFGELFERFNRVVNVRNLLEFQEWISPFFGHSMREKWKMCECLQLMDYDKARYYAKEYVKRMEFAKQRYKETYEYGMKVAKNVSQKQRCQKTYESFLNSLSNEDIDWWIDMIEQKQYNATENKIFENIEISTKTCGLLY